MWNSFHFLQWRVWSVPYQLLCYREPCLWKRLCSMPLPPRSRGTEYGSIQGSQSLFWDMSPGSAAASLHDGKIWSSNLRPVVVTSVNPLQERAGWQSTLWASHNSEHEVNTGPSIPSAHSWGTRLVSHDKFLESHKVKCFKDHLCSLGSSSLDLSIFG